jgi:hypothetical protein
MKVGYLFGTGQSNEPWTNIGGALNLTDDRQLDPINYAREAIDEFRQPKAGKTIYRELTRRQARLHCTRPRSTTHPIRLVLTSIRL